MDLKCKNAQIEVSKHIQECNECLTAVKEGKVDFDHFQIVQKARSDYAVQIREAFLIRTLKPEINKQMYQSGALYFVKIFTLLLLGQFDFTVGVEYCKSGPTVLTTSLDMEYLDRGNKFCMSP